MIREIDLIVDVLASISSDDLVGVVNDLLSVPGFLICEIMLIEFLSITSVQIYANYMPNYMPNMSNLKYSEYFKFSKCRICQLHAKLKNAKYFKFKKIFQLNGKLKYAKFKIC